MNTNLRDIRNVKPDHWFKSIHELNFNSDERLEINPDRIEYLKMWTGETFIHFDGTAFWNNQDKCFDIDSLMRAGITHWRIPTN